MSEQLRPEPLTGEMLAIELGMDAARLEERSIDDQTARLIAGQLHTGQVSAMYSLASCGAVDFEGLSAEVVRESERPDTDEDMRKMYQHVASYALNHAGRGPVEGWNNMRFEEEPQPTPLVWIGEVAAHVNGQLRGRWMNAAQEPDELQAHINELLDSSPYEGSEGWIILESANFYGLPISEYMNLDSLTQLAKGVETHGESFARWVGLQGVQYLDHAIETYEDAFFGEYADEQEAANEWLDHEGAFDAIDLARDHVTDSIKDFLTVDIDAFLQTQPDCHFIVGNDGKCFVFREV